MKKLLFTLCVIPFILSSCSGISKGIAQAVLEQPEEDARQCRIVGSPVTGVTHSVDQQFLKGELHSTKVLMVHGISEHLPGYSYPFREKLVKSLGLTAIQDDYKEIKLRHPDYNKPDGSPAEMGTLRVYRHFNPKGSQEILFYELTWSPITEPRKSLIAFDSSVEYTHERASLNAGLKKFMNTTVPDLLIYLGTKKEQINISVAQSVCWMFSGDWDVLEDGAHEFCNPHKDNVPQVVKDDDFFFVTHSLGSRITLDMIHFFSIDFAQQSNVPSMVKDLNRAIKDKEFTVFMLANQLPLLEMAHDPPAVTNSKDKYCYADSPLKHERVMKKMNIIAFSDPNDILSYPVPPRFANDHIDSRICPEVTNVNLNVAGEKSVFGITEFADPLKAHQGYQQDDRVIGIITEGITRGGKSASIVEERCEWTEMRSGR